MKYHRIVLDNGKLSDARLAIRSNDVVNSLTGNSFFPTPVPPLADVAARRTAFMEALEKTTTGDRQLIALKNQARELLVADLYQLGMYVQAQANGDLAKLLSSSFEVSSQGDSTLGALINFALSDGNLPGELVLSCDAAANATGYLFEITENPNAENANWITLASTRRKITARNLKSNVRYYARIRAMGRKNQECCTEILSRVVQ